MHTCLIEPLMEDSYLDFAELTPLLAERFQVEVARFTPDRQEQIQCLTTGLNTPESPVQFGLARPWCQRVSIMDKWEHKARAWLHQRPQNFLCLVHGGLMSLFRGGHAGMMPWDNDVDTENCSTAPSESYQVSDDWFITGLRISDFPYRYRLFGRVEVRFNQYWLEHHFFKQAGQGRRYKSIAIKMHQTMNFSTTESMFRPLACDLEHTACLPTCSPTRCEFEDHFVHVDYWE